jgi:hypothetical protein
MRTAHREPVTAYVTPATLRALRERATTEDRTISQVVARTLRASLLDSQITDTPAAPRSNRASAAASDAASGPIAA